MSYTRNILSGNEIWQIEKLVMHSEALRWLVNYNAFPKNVKAKPTLPYKTEIKIYSGFKV